jgi:hypothetical protein
MKVAVVAGGEESGCLISQAVRNLETRAPL